MSLPAAIAAGTAGPGPPIVATILWPPMRSTDEGPSERPPPGTLSSSTDVWASPIDGRPVTMRVACHAG